MTIGSTLRTALGATLVATGLAVAGHGAWIPAKAWLAQRLIDRAWAQTGSSVVAARAGNSTGFVAPWGGGSSPAGGTPGAVSAARGIRPWPWADTVPVARLHFVRQQQHRVVLEGDSGAVLAFGPGHRVDSPLPAAGGNAVISAHRDTHFAVLSTVRPGDPISVETWQARVGGGPSPVRYAVVDARILDADDPVAVAEVIGDAGDDRLSLITCWPFDAIATGTRWRYVVTAVRERGTGADRPDPSDSQRRWQPRHRDPDTLVASTGA
jgi:sortase A